MQQIMIILFLWVFSSSSFALEALYPFDRPEQKARFGRLIKSYRCVVCENQTLAESEATLARDLRSIIYQKVQKNETDSEINFYLKNRFGSFIEYKPAFALNTVLLWLGPFLFLLIGLVLVWKHSRAQSKI
jgi:cytochrome c-type biogenesis protein CcmH